MSAIYHSRILRHKTIKTNNMQYCKSVNLRMRDRRNGTKSLFLDFWPGYRNPETMEPVSYTHLDVYKRQTQGYDRLHGDSQPTYQRGQHRI